MKLWQLGMASAAVIALLACKQTQQQPATYSLEPHEPLAQMDTPPATTTDPYATDPLVTPPEKTSPVADEVSAASAKEEATATDKAGGVRTHIVAKGDTLYSLARQYYSDQSRWRDIWEANQTRVPDPNKLTVGTKLIIP